MPQNTSSPAFFVKDPFTDEIQGPFNIQQLKHWYYQGGFESWMVGKSKDGPWKQASKIKGLSSLRPSNPPNAITNSDRDRSAFYKHIQEQKYIQDSIQDSFGNRASDSTTASSTAPSPPPITKNEETDLPATDHKKIALGIIIMGLLLFAVGVYLDNKPLGGTGLWTMIFGTVFRFYGKKIKIPLPYLIPAGLVLFGLIIMIVGIASDTSVETGTEFGRVHNIGLMQQQRNIMMFGGLLFVAGLVIGGFSYMDNKSK